MSTQAVDDNVNKKRKAGFMEYAKILDTFMASIGAESGLSSNTVNAYTSDLIDFGKFLYFQLHKEVKKATRTEIRAYINHLCQLEMESTSVSRKLSSIKRLFKFLSSEGKINNDPSSAIEAPKIKNRMPKYATDKSVKKMIEECRKEGGLNGLRDELIIEMLYTTGLRVSELIQVQTKSILQSIKQPLQNGRKMLSVIGKGRKERFVPIKESVAELVVKYIDEIAREGVKETENQIAKEEQKELRSQQESSAEESGSKKNSAPQKQGTNQKRKDKDEPAYKIAKFLFLGNLPGNGKFIANKPHITRETVWTILKRRAEQAGVDATFISPHVLRHSFATNLCNKDVGIRFVQELLGHSSISTTEIYLHTLENKMADFVEENHPLAKLKKQGTEEAITE